jgi:hypothetical protein
VTEDVHVIAAVFANELGDLIGGAHCGARAASSVLANFCGALSPWAWHPRKTVFVQVGKLKPFSDVGGRHVVRRAALRRT